MRFFFSFLSLIKVASGPKKCLWIKSPARSIVYEISSSPIILYLCFSRSCGSHSYIEATGELGEPGEPGAERRKPVDGAVRGGRFECIEQLRGQVALYLDEEGNHKSVQGRHRRGRRFGRQKRRTGYRECNVAEGNNRLRESQFLTYASWANNLYRVVCVMYLLC